MMGEDIKRFDDIKRMDIAEFRELGLLQEVNRRLLHPLGLALEVELLPCYHVRRTGAGDPNAIGTDCLDCHGSGKIERLGGIWDYRDDPEGMYYGPGMLDPAKYHHVQAMLDDAQPRREDGLGFFIQPLWPEDEEP